MLVKCPDGLLAAAKIFKQVADYSSELSILRQLNSPWTLKVIDCGEKGVASGDYQTFGLKEPAFAYIVMELADNGELFDYLDISGPVSAKIARYYFRNLVAALDYLHSSGIAHRDIKLQNLLLTKDFNIKLADFGLSSSPPKSEVTSLRGTLRYDKSNNGCASYMPPEALSSPADELEDGGFKADIYAAGIVLFNLLTGCMPYSKATPDNDLYLMFEEKREAFWEHHQRYSFEGKVPDDLKELLSGMLEPWPGKRWGLKQVKSCGWFNAECASHKLVSREMQHRRSCVDMAKTFPEKRLEIAKSCTASSRERSRHRTQGKSAADSSSFNYESMGMALWRICTSLLGA